MDESKMNSTTGNKLFAIVNIKRARIAIDMYPKECEAQIKNWP